eukprot:116115-Prymnesium_polylepis.2
MLANHVPTHTGVMLANHVPTHTRTPRVVKRPGSLLPGQRPQLLVHKAVGQARASHGQARCRAARRIRRRLSGANLYGQPGAVDDGIARALPRVARLALLAAQVESDRCDGHAVVLRRGGARVQRGHISQKLAARGVLGQLGTAKDVVHRGDTVPRRSRP